jgi:hypothetical protein
MDENRREREQVKVRSEETSRESEPRAHEAPEPDTRRAGLPEEQRNWFTTPTE